MLCVPYIELWDLKIAIGLHTYWTCGQCCVFRKLDDGDLIIVIGVYVLDMWSVLCVMWTMWVLCSNIVIGLSILDM